MQIVNSSFFTRQNSLNVPLAMQTPTAGISLPSNQNYIDSICIKVERELLLNALGLLLYKDLQTNPTHARWDKLIKGEDYGDKVWIGLEHEFSLIAQKVYENYLTETNAFLTQSGVVQTNSENANLVTPSYKIVNANQSFIKQYQGINGSVPIFYNNFTDWSGDCDDLEVSLYRYLVDKKADFPTWDASRFRFYETKNSFGI